MQNNNPSGDNFFCSLLGGPNSSAAGWPVQEHAAHTVIINQQTPATEVYYVESGLLKLSRIDPSGREVISGLRRSRWVIGAPAVLLRQQYSFTVTTLVASRLRSISAEKFLHLVETDTYFSRDLLTILSQELFIQGQKFANLGCLRAKDRLKRLLYEIITEMDLSARPRQEIKLRVPLKHSEMAQMIAVTPEHLSRLLKALEQEEVIMRDGSMLTVRNATALIADCER